MIIHLCILLVNKNCKNKIKRTELSTAIILFFRIITIWKLSKNFAYEHNAKNKNQIFLKTSREKNYSFMIGPNFRIWILVLDHNQLSHLKCLDNVELKLSILIWLYQTQTFLFFHWDSHQEIMNAFIIVFQWCLGWARVVGCCSVQWAKRNSERAILNSCLPHAKFSLKLKLTKNGSQLHKSKNFLT